MAAHNQSHIENWIMRNTHPSDISKEALKETKPLQESVRKQIKPRSVDLYEVSCGILYLLKSTRQWRILPSEYPKWRFEHPRAA
jgi:transposase